MFLGKIVIANFAMLLTLFILFNLKLNAITTLLSVCLAGLVYICILLLIKICDKKDIAMLKYKKIKQQKIIKNNKNLKKLLKNNKKLLKICKF